MFVATFVNNSNVYNMNAYHRILFEKNTKI